jgi:hypothetical protein
MIAGTLSCVCSGARAEPWQPARGAVIMPVMATGKALDREEYIEQAYFFRALRDRLNEGLATQEALERIDQEILATTRLPYAIQFLAVELKHSGLLSSGFARLGHYFTPFQAFIIRGTEEEGRRFATEAGLLVLQREAEYRAGTPIPQGLFVYQFEVLCRNRLGYDDGLAAMAGDPLYDADWQAFLEMTRKQVGLIDFADILYSRSVDYVREQRRDRPDYVPSLPPLFGEKEGKIARANSGRDPLFLFSALQRHLSYPEVPRPRPRDDISAKVETLQAKIRELEARIRLIDSELRGQIDLSQFGKPELLQDWPKDQEDA